MNLKPGQPVPIIAQLHDGNESAKIKARVLSPIGEELKSLELIHVAKGLYRPPLLYTMPDVEFITVVYEPQDMENYSMSVETYYTEEVPVKEKVYIGEIVSTKKTNEVVGICI